jgi:hypothetical protein
MGHFEDGSRGDQSDLGRLDFRGNTLGWFRMAIIRSHHNQSFLKGYSERKANILVDNVKIDQLCNVLKNDINMLHTHRPPHIPIHAIHDNDLDTIKAVAETWEVKHGFPCTHHCPK